METWWGQTDIAYLWLQANSRQLLLFILVTAAFILLWRSSWNNRYRRIMKTTFERTQLYVTVTRSNKKTHKLFPSLYRISENEDPEYYIFEYKLPIGMTVKQFEEKKKFFETAFDSKAVISGEGLILSIKIKKVKMEHAA
ncbi:hypothetical protein [Paenibacillus gansuensis]|uniref:Uncharacterized protein n=1 Tax=Paenibacillus gansuensis TaxID=306542 RepID=A0ABW5PFR9_9BACL